MVELDKSIDLADIKPNLRVALRNDSYALHKVCPSLAHGGLHLHPPCAICSPTPLQRAAPQILPSKVDPLVSLMKVEKVPDSTYDMVGGLDKQVKEIKEVVELPIKHPELFDALGVAQPKVCDFSLLVCLLARLLDFRLVLLRFCSFQSSPKPHSFFEFFAAFGAVARGARVCTDSSLLELGLLQGVLLYGPPGTGKTLLARAVAHHTDCTFIRVSGGELVQKYIGEGSRMVRELFVMARECVRHSFL